MSDATGGVSPLSNEVPDSPSPCAGRGPGGGVSWRTPPNLWLKLKPIARQMRKEPTEAEDRLWQQLRKKRLGPKFRRQHAIDRFIVDFYARAAGLVVEVDGPIHQYSAAEDAVRQEFLESQGLRVLRFTNDQVMDDLEGVLAEIDRAVNERSDEPDAGDTFGPQDIFHYIYAILHAPTYRVRYADFLKRDFPRIPLTSDPALFWELARLGAELTALHLMESPSLNDLLTRFPEVGDNVVGNLRYTAPRREDDGRVAPGRVCINQTQYFEGVAPDVWEFQIGGYQVLHKWLKDRKGRALAFDDLLHYQKIVVALTETMRLMEEIDDAIPVWPVD